MRHAAQRTIALQDNFPVDGSLYMPDIKDTGGSMAKALRDWERRRGISYSFKGRFIAQKKKEEPEEKPKAQKPAADLIKVPRDRKPDSEERKRRKIEHNRKYREANKEKCKEAVRRCKERAKALRDLRNRAA